MPQSDEPHLESVEDPILDCGYELGDLKEVYRKYHKGTEPQTAFVIELLAMQAAVIAEVSTLFDTQVKEAREEQVMQDFLALSEWDTQHDESELIEWRNRQLERLQAKGEADV